MAKAVDKDKATKAVSYVRMTVRTSCNACQTKNTSIAKTITSALTTAALATLEATAAYLSTLNATSHRPRTTRRKLSRLEAITARIKARNNLIAEQTLYKLTKTTKKSTITSILLITTNISQKNAPLSA